MYLPAKFWSAVTYLANCLSLDPIEPVGPQQPLPGAADFHVSPVVHSHPASVSVVAPAASSALTNWKVEKIADDGRNARPIFIPPAARPEPDGSDFKCDYDMPGYRACSDPEDRSCWLYNEETGHAFNTSTNYEDEAPIGKVRDYTLVIEDGDWNTDGLISKNMKLVNGSYPGPLIQACWGDTLNIKVINKLRHNGTAVHWHGIRQNQTMHMDGVPGITQCPIAPDDYFYYKFKATQYGSSWYHSHYSVQYADGLLGPMTIHGPSTGDWDEYKSPLLMSDWFHNSAFAVIHGKTPGYPTMLFNGVGDVSRYKYGITPNAPIPQRYQLTFRKDEDKPKRYLLRLINTSFTTAFIFSIDHHYLIVIGADFVPVEPDQRTHVQIGIGQRYTVIVVADPEKASEETLKSGNYWIRATIAKCFRNAISNTLEGYDQMGVVRYNPDSVLNPKSTQWGDINPDCKDEAGLVPWLPWNIKPPRNNRNGSTYGEEFMAYSKDDGSTPKFPLGGWSFERDGLKDGWNPLQIDYNDTFFLHLNETSRKEWPKAWVVVPEDYTKDDFVYLAITGMGRLNPEGKHGAHPIHLHGHDFAVMEQRYNEKFDPNKDFNFTKENYPNPMRRDVALLPNNGYLIIAFKADNPGSWIMHCHIAFHASEGLALQINERQKDADDIWPNDRDGFYNRQIIEAKRVCKRWNDFQSDCTRHWPGKDWENNCWPACRAEIPEHKMYACKVDTLKDHVFQDDSGI